MSDDVKNMLLGAGLTTFGFILTMIWDLYKSNSESSNKEKRLKSLLSNDIKKLKERLAKLDEIVRDELEVMNNNQTLVLSLPHLNLMYPGILLIERPKFLESNNSLAEKLFELEVETSYLNELIAAREAHKTNNGAMTNYMSRLKTQNEVILTYILRVQECLNSEELKYCSTL